MFEWGRGLTRAWNLPCFSSLGVPQDGYVDWSKVDVAKVDVPPGEDMGILRYEATKIHIEKETRFLGVRSPSLARAHLSIAVCLAAAKAAHPAPSPPPRQPPNPGRTRTTARARTA